MKIKKLELYYCENPACFEILVRNNKFQEFELGTNGWNVACAPSCVKLWKMTSRKWTTYLKHLIAPVMAKFSEIMLTIKNLNR